MSQSKRMIYRENGRAADGKLPPPSSPPPESAVAPCLISGYYKMGRRNFLFTKKADGFSAPAVMTTYE